MKNDMSKYVHTNMELVHNWANRRFRTNDEYISEDGYRVIGDRLYYGNKLLAYIERDFYFILEFDHVRTWGFGGRSKHLNSNSIVSAIPKGNHYVFKKLPIFHLNYDFKKWYTEQFIYHNTNTGELIADIKDYIYNNRRKVIYHYNYDNLDRLRDKLKAIRFSLIPLPNWFTKGKDNLIQNATINHSYVATRYTGWGDSSKYFTNPFKIDDKIKNILDIQFITDDDIDKFLFKFWYLKYNLTYRESKSYREVYDDPIKRKEFEDGHAARLKRVADAKEAKRLKEEQEIYKGYFKRLYDWQTNSSLRFDRGYYTNIYTSIKLVNDVNPFVISSLIVKMDIDNAKKLYKLFKKYHDKKVDFRNQNINFDGWQLMGIEPRVVYVHNDGTTAMETHSCLVIGCHTIPWFEVERFIKYHALDW